MARKLGVGSDAWIAEAVAEYAEDLGVGPDELSERERLEAIEERVDRWAKVEASEPRGPEPRLSLSAAHDPAPAREERLRADESELDEAVERLERRPAPTRGRLETALAEIEARAERNEARTTRALESLGGFVQARDAERGRLESAIEKIEKRAERAESRTARAIESLSGLVEGRTDEKDRLEQSVREIESRASRNEDRTARAISSLSGLVQGRGDERERLEAAIAQAEARAEKTAERTARALESLSGLVETRRSERERLEDAIARVSARAEQSEARTAQALESLTTLAHPAAAEVSDVVAARFNDLARRAAPPAPPAAGADESDDTFRLVAERLARRRKPRPEAAAPLPESPAPQPRHEDMAAQGVGAMRGDLRRLIDKVETLAAAPGEDLRAQVKSVESALATANENAVAVERIERRIAALAERMEGAVAGSPNPAEMAQALKALADALSEIERGAPVAAMHAIERRLEELGARVEAAARRPASDPRPIEELARRLDAVRVAVERQGASRPDSAVFAAALTHLDEKLDRASADGAQSATTLAALQGAIARLEDGLKTSAAPPDLRPIEDVARRVEGVRSIVERQSGLAPKVDQLHAAVGELKSRFDRPAAAGVEIERIEAALRRIGSQVDGALARSAVVDLKPIEELGARIETVRKAVERNGALSPQIERLESGLADIRARLDRAPQLDAVDATLRKLAAKFEEAIGRPQALDAGRIDDLARRIDNVKGGFAPHAARLEAALGAISAKLDQPAAGVETDAALRRLAAKVEEAVSRPAALDPKLIDELARRIESVKAIAERGFAPHAARLEAALVDIRARLEQPAGSSDVDGALRRLASKVEEAVNRPPTVDPRPLEELARRIESVKGVAERGFAPHAARLEASLGEISAKLDRPSSHPEIDAALRRLAAKVDEAVSRPTTVSLDPRPIEELARRIESVRESLDRPPALGPQVERLETALGAVSEKLDRAQPAIDANGINSTLAAMNARLEDAFRQPAQIEIDHEPIEALARRFEAVRETIERQGEQLDEVGRPIDALAQRLESLRETVERRAEPLDADRLQDALRDALEAHDRPHRAAFERLTAKVEDDADGKRVEDLLELVIARLDRPSVRPADLAAVADAISDLAGRIEPPDLARLEALIQSHARRGADLSPVADAIAGVSARLDRLNFGADAGRIEELFGEVLSRLDHPGFSAADMATMAEAIADIGEKVERSGGASSPVLEDLVRGVLHRLEGLESRIEEQGGPVDAGLGHVEIAVRELGDKVGEIRAAIDTRALSQDSLSHDMRLLHDKVDDLADAQAKGGLAGPAGDALARDLGSRFAAANPEALLGHLQDIHERIDVLASARLAPSALEHALSELSEELESFRTARESVGRSAATLSEMRAEQMQFDRRMDARFSGVQDILEKLVDRLGRLEREAAADADAPPPPAPRPPSGGVGPRSVLLDIPDRLPSELRAAAPPSPEPPQPRMREPVEATTAKSAAINAHIAAARRAANAAAADTERREEMDAARKTAKTSGGLAQRAQSLLTQHRRPVLLGAAGVMTLLTGVAVLELRSHTPKRVSEIDAPATPVADVAPTAPGAAALDTTPTGAIGEAKVISAPLAPPAPPQKESAKPSSTLIAALPAGLEASLAGAGANGDVGAEVEIAQRYLEGRSVARDPKMGAGWMQTAAESGNVFAQYRLGALYEKGIGVARDSAKARELYTKAAEAGNARAMHNLAVLYAQDGGAGKPDYAAALDWFRRASAYGVRDSQFNLGVLYGRGLGAAQDMAQSWMWFSLAAKQGDADATHKRDEVANRMDGRAMAAGKKLLDDYHAKTPDPAVNDPPPAPAPATAGDSAKAPGAKI